MSYQPPTMNAPIANQQQRARQGSPVADLPHPRSVLIRPTRPALSSNRPRPIGHKKSVSLVGQVGADSVRCTTTWDVREDEVTPLPPFFPLERTHAVVDDTPCCVIAGRIADCMRVGSIAASFDEKACADAETADHVRFNVRLFRDHQQAKRIFVEVQRRSGCCVKFHNVCGTVLRAAQGIPAKRASENRSLPPLSFVNSADGSENSLQGIEEALELAGGLLKKDRLDANVLGMESLRMLSDAKCSGHRRALCASRKILAQEGDVSESIASLVKVWRLHEEEEEESGADESRRYEVMRNHALAVLANSLTLLSRAGELDKLLGSFHWARDDALLVALVQDLEDAERRPHDSYQAARCLNVLSRASDSIRTRSLDLGLHTATQVCFNEGICKHAMLASESRDMMENLSGKVLA